MSEPLSPVPFPFRMLSRAASIPRPDFQCNCPLPIPGLFPVKIVPIRLATRRRINPSLSDASLHYPSEFEYATCGAGRSPGGSDPSSVHPSTSYHGLTALGHHSRGWIILWRSCPRSTQVIPTRTMSKPLKSILHRNPIAHV